MATATGCCKRRKTRKTVKFHVDLLLEKKCRRNPQKRGHVSPIWIVVCKNGVYGVPARNRIETTMIWAYKSSSSQCDPSMTNIPCPMPIIFEVLYRTQNATTCWYNMDQHGSFLSRTATSPHATTWQKTSWNLPKAKQTMDEFVEVRFPRKKIGGICFLPLRFPFWGDCNLSDPFLLMFFFLCWNYPFFHFGDTTGFTLVLFLLGGIETSK